MDLPLAEGSSYLSCHRTDTEMLDYIWPSQQLGSSQPLVFVDTYGYDFLSLPLLLSCFRILEPHFHTAQLLGQCLKMKAALSSEFKWISKDEEDFWLPDPFVAYYKRMYQCWRSHRGPDQHNQVVHQCSAYKLIWWIKIHTEIDSTVLLSNKRTFWGCFILGLKRKAFL